MAKKEEKENKRGKLLTATLTIFFLIELWSLSSVLGSNFTQVNKFHLTYPSWYQKVEILARVTSIGAIIGIWRLKKIAVYVAIVVVIISLPVLLFISVNYSTKAIPILAYLLFSVVFYFLFYYPVYKRWKYFN